MSAHDATTTPPRIRVLSLGGTIAMTGGDGGGVVPSITAEALVAAVPGLDRVADVTAEQFRQLPGASLTVADLQDVARRVAVLADEGCDGVVITQGTDTIEETAFLLDLLVEGDMAVIVTGAMRPPTLPGADGPANLLAAVLVAGHPAARGAGPLVVMNDEVHAARFVTKRHTMSPAAFASPATGPLGWVAERRVGLPGAAPARHTVPGGLDADVAPVALLRLGLGDDARMASCLEQLGYRGAVVEALGGGHAPQEAVEALTSLVARMPVVLASRTGAGPVLSGTYGFVGSERDLLDRGLIHAGLLDGPKSRVLLGLAVGAGLDRAAVAGLFHALGVPVPAARR